MNRKEHVWTVVSNVLSNLKDVSRSQPVTYTVNVVVSRTRCRMESLSLQTTNRKWREAYQIAAIRMTLSDLQGHSPVVSLYRRDFSYSCTADDKISADSFDAVRSVSDSWASCQQYGSSFQRQDHQRHDYYQHHVHFTALSRSWWVRRLPVGLPLSSNFLLEYSSEYINEYSSTR